MPRGVWGSPELRQKAVAVRRANLAAKKAAAERVAKKEAAKRERAERNHVRDPHVKLCRKERKRFAEVEAQRIEEAKREFERFLAADEARRKGGPSSRSGKPRGPGIHVFARADL